MGAAMAEAAKRRVIMVVNCILMDLIFIFLFFERERCVCD